MSIEIVEPIGSVDVMFSFFTAKLYLCLEIIGLLVEIHIEAYLVSFLVRCLIHSHACASFQTKIHIEHIIGFTP